MIHDENLVTKVRDFLATQQSLGVAQDHGSYYVYARAFGGTDSDWDMHCGPYPSFNDAVNWIREIKEKP